LTVSTPRGITLCADDYALSAPVSAGILALARAGRLHAISCMTDSPRWADDGALLRDLPGVEIGLHLNFTEAFPAAQPVRPLSSLILACWLRRLDAAQVQASVRRQWDAFVAVMGRAPDFVDGHQHVHQFPQIREALLALLAEQSYQGWLRNLTGLQATPGMGFKILILKLLGAGHFAALCHHAGLRSNPYFSGVYDFSPQADYRGLMQGWLRASPAATLIMCHPAQAGAGDGIGLARLHEFTYLQSADFISDCQQHAVRLASVTETAYAQA
jgi:predicted glycoside hydrolase/deacetylase ChbG (UPF0249 family)